MIKTVFQYPNLEDTNHRTSEVEQHAQLGLPATDDRGPPPLPSRTGSALYLSPDRWPGQQHSASLPSREYPVGESL